MEKKKVVIIGAGFGGLAAAKALKKASHLDVILINKTNHHLFQPLLYQVATASLAASEIAISIRGILRRQKNLKVVMEEVIAIDKKKNVVTLSDKSTISFDYLIIATGSRHSYFGNPQWEKYAPGLKTVHDALSLRDDLLSSFEKAEYEAFKGDCPTETIEKYTNFVIIGGGPTGVEMAGAIAEVSKKTLLKNFHHIDPSAAKITLIEAGPRLLQAYPEPLSAKAKTALEKLGVTVLVNTQVTDVTSEGVKTRSKDRELFFTTQNILWAAGNEAPALLKQLDVPLDRAGRVVVEPDLSIPGSSHIFVIGDSCSIIDPLTKAPCPGIAPLAIQSGECVADYIRLNTPLPRPPFFYLDKGSMATIGKGKAVGIVPLGFLGTFQVSGFSAWLSWCFIHIFYLVGFRNRISVMLEWFIVFLTGQRGVRVIYRKQENERK